jgi:hypothetical protein
MHWSARLHSPIKLADGRTLRTLSDVRAMLLTLPGDEQTWPKMQTVAYIIIRAARAGNRELTAAVSLRVEELLRYPPFVSARLAEALADDDVAKRPTAPSVERTPKSDAGHRRKFS